MARLPSIRLLRATRALRALPVDQRRLLAPAVVHVLAVRLCLRAVPLPRLERFAARDRRRSRPEDPASVAAAIAVASRLVPGTTCLASALAGQWLLRRHGQASELRFGVLRSAGESFQAHAWLEVNGERLIGGDGVETYSPLSATGG